MTDQEVIKMVAEDLEYLKKEWNRDVNDVSLRNTSVCLRKLLTEDTYGRAWRLVGFKKQPRIKAPNLNKIIGNTPIKLIDFAEASGADCGPGQIDFFMSSNEIMTEEAIFKESQLMLDKSNTWTDFNLTEFVESGCLVIEGSKVSRREVILYVVNKNGGAHIDHYRKATDIAFKALDNLNTDFKLGEKNVIFHTILAIGQCVVNSDDTTKFLSLVKEKY